jgi:hypothetical protein
MGILALARGVGAPNIAFRACGAWPGGPHLNLPSWTRRGVQLAWLPRMFRAVLAPRSRVYVCMKAVVVVS